MGCSGSKSESVQTPKQRRRLSVGQVDDTVGGESTQPCSEEDRGLITAISCSQKLQHELQQQQDEPAQRGRFSICSKTDEAKTSFANKPVAQAGDAYDKLFEPNALGLGFTCRKGLKPESPNQDSWTVLKVDGKFALYGVFDGHGKQGHDVSNYVKEALPMLIISDPRFKTKEMPKMLMESFSKVQSLVNTADRMKKLSAQMSGTTATVCVHDLVQNVITVAHVADSTCVLGTWEDDGRKIRGEALTRDHKPNLADEKARIEKAGGRVIFDGYANHRVYAKNGRYPGLNMSRCLGDLMGHADAGCSAEPEVTTRQIMPQDNVLLLCSDGVWEFISPQEAVEKVSLENKEAMRNADILAKEAWDRWIRNEGGAVVDDITVVLVYLKAAMQSASNP